MQELKVSCNILLDLFFFNFLFLKQQSCITNFSFLVQIPADHTKDLLPISEVIPETMIMVSEALFSLLIPL